MTWFDTALFVAFLVIAVITARSYAPSTPELDGERFFKVVLATLLRGRVEGRGGDAAAWQAEVVRFIPYHPLGRYPEIKIEGRLPAIPDLLPGEKVLVERIDKESTRAARWARLSDLEEESLDARLSDPDELGAVYSPQGPLGVEWEAIAKDGDPLAEALKRRIPEVVWVGIRGASPVDVPDVLVGMSIVPNGSPGELAAELLRAAPAADQRLIVIVTGDALVGLIRALHQNPELRDRVLAVVSAGGFAVGDDADWLSAHLRAIELDTESSRPTIYASFQWLDRTVEPPGVQGLELARMRLPVVKGPIAPSEIVVQDLGPLPLDAPGDLIARGIVIWSALTVRKLLP